MAAVDVTSDRWLVRLVGVTVCVAALLAVLSIAIAAYREVEIPDSIDRLGYLLAGGLLGALTTRLTGEPVEVITPDGEPLAVTDQQSRDATTRGLLRGTDTSNFEPMRDPFRPQAAVTDNPTPDPTGRP